MACPTQGIQQLKTAEKSADVKITEARNRKIKRLKQASEEAQIEIEKFRTERDRQFKEFEAKHMGSTDAVSAKIDADVLVQIKQMNVEIENNRGKLLDDILQLVYDIVPKVHVNLKNVKL